MDLGEYSAALAMRLRDAISAPHRDRETVTVPLECACGVAQFLQAHAANLRDVERLNRLDAIGAEWRVIVQGEVVGSGRARSAIDQAITRISQDALPGPTN